MFGLRQRVRFRTAKPRRYYSAVSSESKKRRSLPDFISKYKSGQPLSMVTCYDYTSAVLADQVELDGLLVGDSYKMVMCGEESTSAATIDELVYHCKAVTKGAKSSFVVCDMPFGSYEVSPSSALNSAIRLVKEGNAHAIKLEGGANRVSPQISAIVQAGIPVMGHIGLTPQTAVALGGFQVQGKTAQQAAALVEDAKALEAAGCFALVIESVPQKISAYITSLLGIPTIGIGAGSDTSGQILVWHDMFGLFQDFTPKFCKQYVNLGREIVGALQQYKQEVTVRDFPTPAHSFKLKQEQWDMFKQLFNITEAPKAAKVKAETGEKTAETIGKIPEAIPATQEQQRVQATPQQQQQQSQIPVQSQPIPTQVPRQPKRQPLLQPRLHDNHLKIAIIGGGSMGTFFASKLAAAAQLQQQQPQPGQSQPFVCNISIVSSWEEHVKAINEKGILRQEFNSEPLVSAISLPTTTISNGLITAATDPEKIVWSDDSFYGYPPDVIIVLVKSPNTTKAAQKVHKMIKLAEDIAASSPIVSASLLASPRTITVLTLQNGLGNFETLEQIINNNNDTNNINNNNNNNQEQQQPSTEHHADSGNYSVQILQGITEHGAMMMSPGHVRHTGVGGTTIVGNPENPKIQMLAKLFTQVGIPTSVHPNAQSIIWGKLVLNAAINPITALLGLENGQILTNNSARKMARMAVSEAEKVANALGVSLPYPNAWSKVESLATSTAHNKSSMLVDMQRGEETEINAINGVIVREGQKLGVDVEFNKQLLKTFTQLGSGNGNASGNIDL